MYQHNAIQIMGEFMQCDKGINKKGNIFLQDLMVHVHTVHATFDVMVDRKNCSETYLPQSVYFHAGT